MDSFLLIGQSNMAGRGLISEAREIDNSHIYTLRNGRWHRMFRPIHSDRRTAGVSLGESFAQAYAEKHGTDVGLICCADGGTKLSQWQKGELLYEHAVAQAKLAQRTSVIKGILWHQGEGDCAIELASTYKERLLKMLCDLREDLNLTDVPVIVGELGDFLADCPLSPHLVNYTLINAQLREIAMENADIGCAEAKGLGANEDLLHFNAESLYEFGLRYFAQLERINPTEDKGESGEAPTAYTEMELL